MQLSIVIVNYNVKYFLEQCLAALQLAVQGLDAEIWVVDNNSADDSVAYLQPMFPQVHFMALAQNVGFAKANNAALPHCKGNLILFLNPDTLVPVQALADTVAYLQQHAAAGALGICMVDGTGTFLPESKRGFPSPATSLYKQLGLYKLFPASPRFARYYMGHLSAQTTASVDVLAGAFMMVRKSVLEEVGGFDEQFFMYGEDIDLSYRITQAGHQNIYFAPSNIIHFKGESTAKESLQYVRVFHAAMQQFVQKHFKGYGALFFRTMLYAGIALRAAASAINRLFRPKQPTQVWPFTISFKAIGWPPAIVRPQGMQVAHHFIGIDWNDTADGVTADVLLVVGYSLTMQQAITYIKEHGTSRSCWIHLVKTNSLVMSNNKNKAGIAAVFAQGNQHQ